MIRIVTETEMRTSNFIWEKWHNNKNERVYFGAFKLKKVYADFMILELDGFDQAYYADVKLKETERLFRYETETTRISGMKPIVKINIANGLIYFLQDLYADDDKNLKFESRGVRPEWITIEENIL